MDFVTRINLKTDCKDRKGLINYCLNNTKQQYFSYWLELCLFRRFVTRVFFI